MNQTSDFSLGSNNENIPPSVFRRSHTNSGIFVPDVYVELIGFISDVVTATGAQTFWYVTDHDDLALLADDTLTAEAMTKAYRSSISGVSKEELNRDPPGGRINVPNDLPSGCYNQLNDSDDVILRLLHPDYSELNTACVLVLPPEIYDRHNLKQSYNSIHSKLHFSTHMVATANRKQTTENNSQSLSDLDDCDEASIIGNGSQSPAAADLTLGNKLTHYL